MKIPTIEQLFEQQNPQDGKCPPWAKELAISVAKLHVKAALESAAEQAKYDLINGPYCKDHTPFRGECQNCSSYHNYDVIVGAKIDKQSILESYPETNIK